MSEPSIDEQLEAATDIPSLLKIVDKRGYDRGYEAGIAAAKAASRELSNGPRSVDHPDMPRSLVITELDLTVRSLNCLWSVGVSTIEDVLAYNESDLMDIRSFGEVSLADVRRNLARYGYYLRGESPSNKV